MTTLPRNQKIERALQWTYGMDYALAKDAIAAYCKERSMVFGIDPNGVIQYDRPLKD